MNRSFMSESAEAKTAGHGNNFAVSTKPELEPRVTAVSSESLLSGSNTLVIEHLGMRYVLRATRNGKLILTK